MALETENFLPSVWGFWQRFETLVELRGTGRRRIQFWVAVIFAGRFVPFIYFSNHIPMLVQSTMSCKDTGYFSQLLYYQVRLSRGPDVSPRLSVFRIENLIHRPHNSGDCIYPVAGSGSMKMASEPWDIRTSFSLPAMPECPESRYPK